MKFSIENDIVSICIDDGKVNAANLQFIEDMNEALDCAAAEAKAVVVYGRPGMFSAGFDLKEIANNSNNEKLSREGLALLTRVYAHPQPVVAACDGHAIGLGAFLLLAADVRLGSAEEYTIQLPETAMGWNFPTVLMTLIKARITSAHLSSAVLESRAYDAEDAVAAGFLDQLLDRDALLTECRARAGQMGQLPGEAYGANKENLRSQALKIMRDSIA